MIGNKFLSYETVGWPDCSSRISNGDWFIARIRGGSRLQIQLRQSSVIKAPISFLNIHKLLWKSKILVHGHVRIFLNFVTFPLIVLIKTVEIIKNFFGNGFAINSKQQLKKENSHAWLDYVVPEIFAGRNLG